MLVLSRKRTQSIKVGEGIVITVIETSRGSVKLGIQAPTDVRVLRAELDHRSVNQPTFELDADEVPEPVFSAERFLEAFNADDVAAMEDQALLYTTKL